LVVKASLQLEFDELKNLNGSTTVSPSSEFQQDFCDLNKRKLSMACNYDIENCNSKTLEYGTSVLIDSMVKKITHFSLSLV
jgi:hypothetical protein